MVRPVKSTRSLESAGGDIKTAKDAKRFIENGLWLTAAEVVRRENQIEYRKGNIASAIAVKKFPGSGTAREILSAQESKQLGTAPRNSVVLGKFRTTEVRYATKEDVLAAAIFVWRTLRSALPKSARGFDSMYFWVRDITNRRTVGEYKTPARLASIANQLDAKGINYSINVVGPTVPWRRKMIYSDFGRAGLNKGDTNTLTRRSKAGSKFLGTVSPDRLVGSRPSATIFENYRASIESRTTKAGRKLTQYRVKKAVQHLIVKRARAKYPQVAMGYYSKPAHEPTAPDSLGRRWPQDAKKPYIRGNGFVPSVFITGAVRV